jgi:acyl-CoA synthetase (AMP-forming)/AMP-acid ligase II
MRAYLGQPERYAKCFVGGWYLTGDLAMKDSDGYYWFVGRADDLIKSSGHLIGPFEVESALIEHPAVAEAAVIGIPDETAGEVVKAFVTLKAGFTAGEPWSASCAVMRGSASAPPSPRARSSSATACRARGQARSCGGSCAPGNWAAGGRSVHIGRGCAMSKVKLDHAHVSEPSTRHDPHPPL